MAHGRHAALVAVAALALLGCVLSVRQAVGNAFERTVSVGGNPDAIAVDAALGHVFVVNGADYTVSMLDTASGDVLRTVKAGNGAYALAVDQASSRVFVLNAGDNSVSVLDANSGTPRRTVALGQAPSQAIVDPYTGMAFVADASAPLVQVIDGRSGTLLGQAAVQGDPLAMAVDSKTGRLFVCSMAGISIFDIHHGIVHLRDVLGGHYPIAIAVDQRRQRAYVVDGGDNTVNILDSHSGALLHTTPVPPHPLTLAVDEQRDHVFVASTTAVPSATGSSSLEMLDATSGTLLRTTPVDGSPLALLPDRHDGRVLVDAGLSVLEIDARSGVLVRTIAVRGARVTDGAMAVDERTGHAFVVNTYNPDEESEPALLHWARNLLPWLAHPTAGAGGSVSIWNAGN